MKELERLREEIDRVDKEIVELFEGRMDIVSEVSKYKKENDIGILDSSREEEVLAKNVNYLKNKNLKPYLKNFYIKLMDISKDYQKDIDPKGKLIPPNLTKVALEKNTIRGTTKLICLIGNPVGHSKSPYMHNLSFKSLNLDYSYMAFNIEKGNIKETIAAIRALDIKGFNVTMPYKEEVIEYLDEIKDDAKLIGAVNTVLNDNGRLIGYNTDGKGFIKSLKKRAIKYKGKKIVILGGGGTAKAISIELAIAGASEIVIVNRTLGKAEKIVEIISNNIGNSKARALKLNQEELKRELKDAHILIDTSSLGMGELKDKSMVKDIGTLHKDLFVADTIYSPAKTKLLKMAEDQGCRIMNGMDMLIYQGDIAFKVWTGLNIPENIIATIRGDFFEASKG